MTTGSIHPAGLDDAALLARCERTFGRASGPGGQHRNKVETAVRLVDQPTGLTSQASERRSQAQNQAVALRRLRLKLAIEVRSTEPPPAGGSKMWRSRCRGGRVSVNTEHADYPTLLAEALDGLAHAGWSTPDAAKGLGVTGSQLVKLIAQCPAALAALNDRRSTAGLPKLRG